MREYTLLTFGSVYMDIYCLDFPFNDQITAGEELVGRHYAMAPGGSAVITAMVAAGLGLKPTVVGKVGGDCAGEMVVSELKKKNISSELIVDHTVQTNLGIQFVNNHSTPIQTIVGTANAQLRAEEIANKLEDLIPKTEYLFLSGYFKLKNLQPYYRHILEIAKKHQTKTVLDHGQVNRDVGEREIVGLKDILPLIDIYLPNKREIMSICPSQTVDQACTQIHEINSEILIVVKEDAGGAIAFQQKKANIVSQGYKVEILNNVGAGDSFNAGLIKAMTQNKTLDQALSYANAVAAYKISTNQIPDINDIERFVADQANHKSQ
ncbi:MAG: carbohydrate kinase family protein [Patescibacteria group bacterium]